MFFPISDVTIDPVYLVVLGFLVGIFGGFFGVGGSFLAGPALFALGVPMNFVVGTDLTHIVGKSIVATRTHRALGNIDLRLAAIMVVGTIGGSETGVQFIEILKKHGRVDLVVGVISILVFVGISFFVSVESWRTLKSSGKTKTAPAGSGVKEDRQSFGHIAKWVHRINLPPHVSLPHSGIESISLWAILIVSFVGGIFSGFLGGGAGYIRMPFMVYLWGFRRMSPSARTFLRSWCRPATDRFATPCTATSTF